MACAPRRGVNPRLSWEPADLPAAFLPGGILYLWLEVLECGLQWLPGLLVATHVKLLRPRGGWWGQLGVSELQDTVSPVARLGRWAPGPSKQLELGLLSTGLARPQGSFLPMLPPETGPCGGGRALKDCPSFPSGLTPHPPPR